MRSTYICNKNGKQRTNKFKVMYVESCVITFFYSFSGSFLSNYFVVKIEKKNKKTLSIYIYIYMYIQNNCFCIINFACFISSV